MKYIKILLIFIISFSISGCKSNYQEWSQDYFYMDSYINVKVFTNDKALVEKAFLELNQLYQTYHQLADCYKAYSNLINVYTLNQNVKVGTAVTVPQELYEMLVYGVNFYKESNGLFNIALGNVTSVWHEYRETKQGVPTKKELLDSGNIDLNNLELGSDYKVTKQAAIKLDLGGLAKGYATEVAGNYLTKMGLKQYLINAGGNVKVGKHYAQGKYKIGLEDPLFSDKLYQIVKGEQVAVVTSGGYERFYEYEGVKYHHLIDPNTLYPPDHMEAVTVITPNSAYGDVLATTLFLMPVTVGQKYVASLDDVEAVWYVNSNQIYYSKGFKKYGQE